MRLSVQTEKSSLLFYLGILTFFFILLEISLFIQANQGYLAGFTFVSDQLKIPARVWPQVFIFLLVQLSLHLLYTFFIYIKTCLLSRILPITRGQSEYLGIVLWLGGIIAILCANVVFFPNTKFAVLIAVFLPPAIAKLLLFLLLSIGECLFLLACISLLFFNPWKKWAIGLCLAGLMSLILIPNHKKSVPMEEKTRAPNVIIVGLDSFRPDYKNILNATQSTPFFDQFLQQAAVFTEAYTPLARTFPSWVSILTGQYPLQTGTRFNLAIPEHVPFDKTLPAILKRHGYETLYASDETRFSNFDKKFGFDAVITPPMGLNDFLLGSFNDFPISNLLINTRVGHWLFPYSYANRPVFFTYEPNTFLQLMEPFLAKPRHQPLFLTVHFCLTHYPYMDASFSGQETDVLKRYQASVMRLDKQVQDFFALLQRYQLLNNAIVVLLSDHGEALELPGDRVTQEQLFISAAGKKEKAPAFYPPSLDNEDFNRSAGHGTDVLGLPQYHTLLAFKFYGAKLNAQPISGPISLLSIKPTLLQLLNIPGEKKMAPSLAPFLKHHTASTTLPVTDIFLESDFSPEAMRTVYPDTEKVVLEGIALFQINPQTTLLTVRPDMGNRIIESKQLAVMRGHWMLALYPQNKSYSMPILVNLATGEWTNDLNTPFAKHSPAQSLLAALKRFYGEEVH